MFGFTFYFNISVLFPAIAYNFTYSGYLNESKRVSGKITNISHMVCVCVCVCARVHVACMHLLSRVQLFATQILLFFCLVLLNLRSDTLVK